MKKNLLVFAILMMAGAMGAKAQIQKGNVLIGADLANFNISLNKGGVFTARIDPKAAWFIQNNLALGGYVNLGISTAKGAGTSVDYGVGALGRYYASGADLAVLKHSRFFLEANLGIAGYNPTVGDNTNGLGFGVGPGIAYFITPNIGLETLLKYNHIVGFGSAQSASNLNLSVGFQIYLPGGSVRSAIMNAK